MKIFKAISLLIAFIILFASCHKDTTTKSNTQASEYFPNSVGDYWEYEVHDSTAGYTEVENYTVKVTIVGIRKLIDGNDAYIWQYEYPWGKDSNYVRVINDTVKIYDRYKVETLKGIEFPALIYITPFNNAQRWDGKLLAIDSFHVYSVSSVQTPAGIFNDIFNIYNYYIGPNTEFIDNYWFKPNIGMIKIHLNHYALAPRTYRTWVITQFYLH